MAKESELHSKSTKQDVEGRPLTVRGEGKTSVDELKSSELHQVFNQVCDNVIKIG